MKTFGAFVDEVEKIAFDWHKAREGLVDEGIPLSGATIGAAVGHQNPLRGAALGYAGGSLASLARERLKPKDKRKEAPLSRKVLALSGLGYGLGGLAHGATQSAVSHSSGRVASKLKPWFAHEGPRKALLEEGMPAAGATLGTAYAMGSHKDKK